jgi:hypothetical protein
MWFVPGRLLLWALEQSAVLFVRGCVPAVPCHVEEYRAAQMGSEVSDGLFFCLFA